MTLYTFWQYVAGIYKPENLKFKRRRYNIAKYTFCFVYRENLKAHCHSRARVSLTY